MSKKPLIIFEGVEGSGKSTHIKEISKYLKKKKHSFIKIREPGGSYNSEKIRKLILNKKNKHDKLTDLLLFFAARNENIVSIIKKNYKKKIILIDRFLYSTMAYQHYGMNINLKFINYINNYLLKNIKIDFIFLHKINVHEIKKRINKRKYINRYDKFNIKFYSKVQKGYLKLLKNKKNKLIVNSSKNLKSNKKVVIDKIKDLLN